MPNLHVGPGSIIILYTYTVILGHQYSVPGIEAINVRISVCMNAHAILNVYNVLSHSYRIYFVHDCDLYYETA